MHTYTVDVRRSARDEEPERVSVLAQDEVKARRFAIEGVRLRLDLPASATLFATNVKRVR